MSESLHGLVDYLTRALVDDPEPVNVEERKEDDEVVFYLKVADDDLGKIIGKRGRTAKALRALVGAAAKTRGQRVRLEIVEKPRGDQADAT